MCNIEISVHMCYDCVLQRKKTVYAAYYCDGVYTVGGDKFGLGGHLVYVRAPFAFCTTFWFTEVLLHVESHVVVIPNLVSYQEFTQYTTSYTHTILAIMCYLC